jgi:hypothetical protein
MWRNPPIERYMTDAGLLPWKVRASIHRTGSIEALFAMGDDCDQDEPRRGEPEDEDDPSIENMKAPIRIVRFHEEPMSRADKARLLLFDRVNNEPQLTRRNPLVSKR